MDSMALTSKVLIQQLGRMQWFAYTPEIFSALLIHELVVNSLAGKGLNRILQVFTQVAPRVGVGNVHPLGAQKLCRFCGVFGGHGYAELGSEGACCTRKKDSVINRRNALSNFLYNVKFGVVARNIYGRFSCGLQEETNNGAGYLLNFGDVRAVECRHCGDGNFSRILCHDEGIPGSQAGDIGEAFCLKVLFAVFGSDDVADLGEEGAAASVEVVGVGVVREQDCVDGENRFGGDGGRRQSS